MDALGAQVTAGSQLFFLLKLQLLHPSTSSQTIAHLDQKSRLPLQAQLQRGDLAYLCRQVRYSDVAQSYARVISTSPTLFSSSAFSLHCTYTQTKLVSEQRERQ